MNLFRTYAPIALALIVIGGSIAYLERITERPPALEAKLEIVSKTEKEKKYPHAIELQSPEGFVNTPGITIGELIGKKVILVDFWTYSCINCERTLPYLNAWYETYASHGLEIIGVHTPEFEFEKNLDNVKAAVKKFGVAYPVVQDNDYATWTAYKNRYWPRKYLIDIDGYIVYDHIGEGAYDETEARIREALEERSVRLGLPTEDMSLATPKNPIAVDTSAVGSPEIYFGASRNEALSNGTPLLSGIQTLPTPPKAELNHLYLSGTWNITPEYAENQSEASIFFTYKAKNVYMVLSSETANYVEIWRDGVRLTSELGADVSSDGILTVQNETLYTLIEGKSASTHTLELRIKKPGLRAFTFTFG